VKPNTYEFVKKYIESFGYRLLSKEYKNAKSKLKVKCDKGHEYDVRWDNFKSGQRCPKCFGNVRLAYNFVKESIEKEGYELLSEEYKNIHSKLKVKCNKGHEYEVR
jgi:hypothetical protein